MMSLSKKDEKRLLRKQRIEIKKHKHLSTDIDKVFAKAQKMKKEGKNAT